jgi:hypothetical protein
MVAIPDHSLRSPFYSGEGLDCPERGNPWPGASVPVGIQPCLAPWDTLRAFGHQAATALITPAGPLSYLRPMGSAVGGR